MAFSILETTAKEAARRLLGCVFERTLDGRTVRCQIVETEAYDQTDAASHSYKGRTPRTETMFGPAGRLYVYFTYGMHYCCNVVVGAADEGAAVLIRAVEPLEGEEVLRQRRPGKTGAELTNGPAKTCQALGIDLRLNGHDLSKAPLRLVIRPPLDASEIAITPRIGIKQATDVPWRFYIKENSYVSDRR
jgi:DNA-3-methyladenine glycosylase